MIKIPHILVVEDSESSRLLIQQYLQPENYQLAFAKNGQQALSKAKAHHYDLILMDVELPDIKGFEVCKHLKNNKSTKNIPVIFVTIRRDTKSLMKGFEAGGVDYIHKPFSKEELRMRVHTHLELKQTHDELVLAKEKAEQSDKLKMAFLSNMSHEIRTPMNSIIGFAELLTDKDLSEEEKQENISIIIGSGQQLLTIIDEILEVSKQEAGEVHLVAQKISLNKLLTEIQLIHAPQLKNTAVELSLNFPQQSHITIVADKARLKQIFDNLISNAVKFTPKGQIEIGYGISPDKPGFVEFYVKDSGIGIALKQQELIFERFVQVEDPMTRKFKGTGLGLSIVKKLLELMGGEIRVESNARKGSKFIFTIPFGATDTQDESQQEQEILTISAIEADWHDKTLLVVDDFPQILLFFKQALRKTGARILYANDGLEGLEMYRKHKDEINLAVIDLQMPRLNGMDMAKAIRKEGKDTVLIAQTGLALNIKDDDTREAGFDELLYKPIQLGTLQDILKKYLE